MKKIVVSSALSLLFITLVNSTVFAASTIGTSISTEGDLTVLGSFLGGTTTTSHVLTNFYGGLGDDPVSAKNHLEATVTNRGTGSNNYGDLNTGTSMSATIAPTGTDNDYNIYSASLIQAVTPNTTTAATSEVYGQIINNSYSGGDDQVWLEGLMSSVTNRSTVGYLIGVEAQVRARANANTLYGGYFSTVVGNNSTASNIYGVYNVSAVNAGSTVTNVYQLANVKSLAASTVATNWYGIYSNDLAGAAINTYYSWFDSRGVRRVKEDSFFDGVGQAIDALYNPQFTKYTAGATNYERVSLGQWNGNVAQIGTENGGTGTARGLAFITASTTRMTIGANGNIGIGVTSPTVALQVATSTSNATSTVEIGKASQTKGSCLVMYDAEGTVKYISVQNNALVISATSCK